MSWWTGRARFQGQKPPRRLTAWRGMRRVREDVTVVDFDELLAVPDTAPIIATLLRRTPLTQLLDSHPGAPPLHWEDAVFLLRDAELARAIAYRLVPDAPPREQVAGPARLAAAFEQMLERAPDEADVRAVAAFLVHLGALFCLAELHLREPQAQEPAAVDRARAPRPPASARAGSTTLFALPGALAQRRSAARDAARHRRATGARRALARASRADRGAALRGGDRRARRAAAPAPSARGPRASGLGQATRSLNPEARARSPGPFRGSRRARLYRERRAALGYRP